MVGSQLVIAAAVIVLLAPMAVTLPHMNSIRPGEDTTRYVTTSTDPGTPRDDQDATEEETPLSSSNETASTGPGSACSEHVHCATILICLTSGTCGCPENVPVLVRDADSFACVSSRRLKEFCLSDAECSHANKEARCVESLCRCQTDFYASGDDSTCMPKISTWRPLTTTMFPAVLLILALIVIGSVGYIRLKGGPDDKAPTASGLSFLPRSIREFCMENLRNWFKTWPFKSLSNAGSRLRLLSLSASQRIRFLTFQWDWTRLVEDVPRSDESRNVVEQEAAPAAHDIGVKRERSGPFHWTTFDVTDAPAQRSRSSVRHILLQENARTLSENKYADRREEEFNDQAGRPPTMPRTRISTLSTRTLMPSRAGRRNTLTPPATEATNASRGYRNHRFTPVREEPDEESATCSNNFQRFLPSTGKSSVFTKEELYGGTLRKYRSEVVRQPSTKQGRLTASEGLDPPDASVKEERAVSSARCQPSTTPCCWSTSRDSEYTLWTTVSWETASESEVAERTEAWGSLVKSSQPSWPCEHFAWKLVDRKARTCEAFTVQDDSCPVTLKSSGKDAIAHPYAEVPQFIYSRWPPGQDRTRWRRRVLFSDGATSPTIGSPAATASGVRQRPRGRLIGSGEGRARRWAFAAEEETSRSPRHGSQAIWLRPPPRFERGSLSLDTALATAMLRAERRAKGSSF